MVPSMMAESLPAGAVLTPLPHSTQHRKRRFSPRETGVRHIVNRAGYMLRTKNRITFGLHRIVSAHSRTSTSATTPA
jgi:hypothetical protein